MIITQFLVFAQKYIYFPERVIHIRIGTLPGLGVDICSMSDEQFDNISISTRRGLHEGGGVTWRGKEGEREGGREGGREKGKERGRKRGRKGGRREVQYMYIGK